VKFGSNTAGGATDTKGTAGAVGIGLVFGRGAGLKTGDAKGAGKKTFGGTLGGAICTNKSMEHG
jgi:hypothetical protein